MPQFLIPAAISAGAGLIGSAMQGSAAKSAAKTQAAASDRAAASTMQMFDTTRSDLSRYRDFGLSASDQLQNRFFNNGDLSSAVSPTMGAGDVYRGSPTTNWSDIYAGAPTTGLSDLFSGTAYQPWGTGAAAQNSLEQTPGYQFTLDQGLKSLQNSFAGRGLGISGAAMKGAGQYVTGLANNTFNQQLQNYQGQQAQQYNQLLQGNQQLLAGQQQIFGQGVTGNQQRLTGLQQMFGQGLAGNAQTLAGLGQLYGQQTQSQDTTFSRLMAALGIGQGAAGQTGQFGTQATASANNFLTGGAAAQAAGTVGAANASASGINGIGSNIMSAYMMNQLFGGGGSGSSSAAASFPAGLF